MSMGLGFGSFLQQLAGKLREPQEGRPDFDIFKTLAQQRMQEAKLRAGLQARSEATSQRDRENRNKFIATYTSSPENGNLLGNYIKDPSKKNKELLERAVQTASKLWDNQFSEIPYVQEPVKEKKPKKSVFDFFKWMSAPSRTMQAEVEKAPPEHRPAPYGMPPPMPFPGGYMPPPRFTPTPLPPMPRAGNQNSMITTEDLLNLLDEGDDF